MSEDQGEAAIAAVRRAAELGDIARLRDALDGCIDEKAVVLAACDRLDASALGNLDVSMIVAETLVRATAGTGSGHARALLSLAHCRSYANRFAESLVTLDELDRVATECGDSLLAARGAMARVHPLSRLGHLHDAMRCVNLAREEFGRCGATMLLAKAEANLGVLHKALHEPEAALACFDRAVVAFRAVPPAHAQLESNRGEALLELGDFESAEAAFRSALEILERAGLERAAAIVEGNLADLLGRIGRVSAATMTYERARRRHESAGATGDLARLQAEEAELFAAAGLLEEARTELLSAIEGLDRAGLVAEARRARFALFRVLLRVLSLPAAARVLENIERSPDDARGGDIGRLARAQGELQRAMGRPETALREFARSADLLRDRRIDRALALEGLAACAIELGRDVEARAAIDEGLAVAEALLLRPLAAEFLRLRSIIERRSGDNSLAVQTLSSATALVERTRRSLHAERYRSAFAAQSAAVHEAYASALLAAPDQDVSVIFDAIEGGRQLALFELVAGRSVPIEEEPQPDALGMETRHAVEAVNGLLRDAERIADGPAARVTDWRERLEAAEARLAVVEARVASLDAPRTGDPAPISLARARAELDANALIVEWFVGDGDVHALLVRRDGAEVVRRVVREEVVREAVARWESEVTRRLIAPAESRFGGAMHADADRVLARLGDALLKPLLHRLGGCELVHHVPCGSLQDVPFHLLRINDRYALESGAVTVSPSASLLSAWRRSAGRSSQGHVLVVGVGDDRAPHIEIEAAALAAELSNCVLLLGRDATIDAVCDALRGARHVHFACHGRFFRASPRSSGLRLADGWLTAREIERGRLEGASVVVAACDAGRMTRIGGDESLGLARSLCAAGASELVVAAWTVHDETARDVMLHTYRTLQSRSLIQSLRESVMHHAGARLHPALWGPFVSIGASS